MRRNCNRWQILFYVCNFFPVACVRVSDLLVRAFRNHCLIQNATSLSCQISSKKALVKNPGIGYTQMRFIVRVSPPSSWEVRSIQLTIFVKTVFVKTICITSYVCILNKITAFHSIFI